MKNELATNEQQVSSETLEKVLLGGDISSLKPDQKVAYYKSVCESVGLNPLTKPFDFLRLNGKEVMYVKREATEQLRKINRVSLTITGREVLGDAYVVTARAKAGDREDESTGVVFIKNLVGEALANAYMKAETKAKRRVTLSICGLGLMDETEIEDAAPGEKKANKIQAELEQLTKEIPVNVVAMPSMPGNFKNEPVQVIPIIPKVVNEDAEPPEMESFEDFGTEKRDDSADFFKIEVGNKLKGKTLIEFATDKEKSDLEYWARSTKDWFIKEKKKINPQWQETFENIGQYLGKDI